MYTGPELLKDLKNATGTRSFSNLEDNIYYTALTKSHSQIAEYLKAHIDSKFFMGITQTNLVSGQSIYNDIGKDIVNDIYINVIDAIYIKYDGINFVKADIKDISELEQSREYYEQNQSEKNPFVVISGQNLMIYPLSKKDVSLGIEIIGSKTVKDISENTIKEELFNGKIQEPNYLDLIIKGARPYIYTEIEEFQKEQKIRNEFLNEDLRNMKTELSYRGSQPIVFEEPDYNSIIGGSGLNSFCNQ